MTWNKEWAKWPEYLWGIAELMLFCLSIFAALALIVIAIVWLFSKAYEFVDDWLYARSRKKWYKETAGHKAYKEQGGPW